MGLLNKIFGGSWSPGRDRDGTVDHRVTKRRDETRTAQTSAKKSADVDWQTKENQREAKRVNKGESVNTAADAVDRDPGSGKGTHG